MSTGQPSVPKGDEKIPSPESTEEAEKKKERPRKKVVSALNMTKVEACIDKCRQMYTEWNVTPITGPTRNCHSGLSCITIGQPLEEAQRLGIQAFKSFDRAWDVQGGPDAAAQELIANGSKQEYERQSLLAEMDSARGELYDLFSRLSHSFEREYDEVQT